MRYLSLLLFLSLWLPGRSQSPFTYAFAQDTNVNLTRPRVFERIGPDLYRVFGGSGNNDSAWTYTAHMDASGELTDMRTLRCGVNTTNAMPSGVLRTSDQGMLVAFALPVVGTNAYSFVHTDANGTVEWYRTYPDVYGQQMVDSDKGLAEKDGHYFTMGRVTVVPSNEGHASTMVELDATGNCVVQRTWAGGDIWSGEGQGIVRTADNGLLTVAVEHPYSSNSSWPNLSVQHWTTDLGIDWSNKYSLGYAHGLVRVLATADGGSLLTGYVFPSMGSQQYPFFLRLDAAGAVLWARRSLTSGLIPQSAVEEPDGGFAVCLYKTPAAPIVARLGSDGAFLNAQRASGFAFPVIPWGLTRDADTGEHLLRATGGDQNSTYLFRLDEALAFDCESTPYTWADTLVTPTVNAFPVEVTTAQLNSTDTAWASYPALFSAVDACLSTFVTEDEAVRTNVWPVPTADVVHVEWKGTGAVSCTVLDATGRVVGYEQAARVEGGSLRVDLTGLGAGAYVLRLQGAGAARRVRVVKERIR